MDDSFFKTEKIIETCQNVNVKRNLQVDSILKDFLLC